MDFALPQIGEGVYEAELVRWLVQPGDSVKRGQTLLEVLTDKATMEVPSPFVGKITALKAQPGQQVKVGEVLLSYAGADQPAPAPAPVAAAPAAPAAPAPSAPPQAANGPSPSGGHALPVKAAPSVRHLARKLGIDLNAVRGSGPQGRILIEDLTGHVRPAAGDGARAPSRPEPAARPDYGRPGTRIKVQ